MSELKGKIHSIETFGTVDGPGVRFVVFMQGCPMRCLYCHNPDTWDIRNAEHELSAKEVLLRMERNMPFYRSGGITVTGGEPLVQIEFITELFRLAKADGIHTCVDTSGITYREENADKFDTLLDFTDLVMLDIKHMDTERHKALCGHGNEFPLAFAKHLAKRGIKTRIRYVLVPGYTDSKEALISLKDFIATLDNIEKLEILPYHTLGRPKYENLGIPYPLDGVKDATDEDVKKALDIIQGHLNNC